MDNTGPKIQIQPMNSATVEQVAELEKQCFTHPWSLASLSQELLNPLAVFYTAAVNGQIAGYAGMHHIIDEGYITNIAVGEPFRGQGVAKALINALLLYAGENNLRMITLEVRQSNEAAIGLYESFDFVRAGLRRGYYTSPDEDAALMTKEFAPPV